ncbi:AMP-binding protein [Pseudonocardia sp. GCM10023141]|uniref:AMP-binding protein n=1 Tax=Pseudonocardia sp. GCM10023141 TaxID=3252653 RepID=UPI00360B4A82
MIIETSYHPADTSEPVLDLTAGDLLRGAAADAPDTVAIRELVPAGMGSLTGAERTDRSWTYAELLADAEACARWLLVRLRPGERIVVWAPNVPEWVVLQYGAALAGLVIVTANPALRAGELRYVLEQSRASGLFAASAFRGTDMDAIATEALDGLTAVREHVRFAEWPALAAEARGLTGDLPAVAAGDPAQIQYTSGTTGFPKGALLAHRGLVTNAYYIGIRAEMERGSTWISPMPLFHTAGCAMGVLGSAHLRATLLLPLLFDPALVLDAIGTFRPAAVLGVPTMLIAMLAHPAFATTDVSSVRMAMSGGSAVPPELVRRVESAFGCGFSTVYGQTELSPIITQTSPSDLPDDRADTTGRPLWNAEVKIADPVDGSPVPIGEQGEIRVRGYLSMIEYFDLPEQTADALDADGWVHTGDLGTLDERGYLRITGRLKDMIIRGGENMFPAEIEQVLFTDSDVAEIAVVGVPDPTWGEVVAAVIRPRDPDAPPTVEKLRALCRSELAPAKTPSLWFVATELPFTGSGKIQKFRVQELLAAGTYKPLD